MVPSFVLSPFQILLNYLSDELHERNLHSLIHVCGDIIPGAQRERITTGWDVFSILRQRNIIGNEPEKMANLLAIIKELRPKRKDLVVKIKRHIQENYEEPDSLLKDLESSSDNTLPFRDRVISRPPTSMPLVPQEDCCRVHCPGVAFSCNPCCDARCCSLILAMLFSLLALLTLMAWLLGKKDLDSEIQKAVVSVSVFLIVCSVISIICRRYWRPRDQLNYTVLPASHEIRSNLASYATLKYSRTSYNSMGQRTESPRHECSCQSAQNTASSSLTSRASSVLSYTALLPDDIVPDGFPREDFPEFFVQNVEDDLIEV